MEAIVIFRKKSRKEKFFKKLNKLIQMLKGEGMILRTLKESSSSSSGDYFVGETVKSTSWFRLKEQFR